MKPIYNYHAIRAIIGLGNPGSRFTNTRHNIGFRILDSLAKDHAANFQTYKNLEYTEITPNSDSHDIMLIKPLTFMNESGRIAPFLQKKGIKNEEIIVVHDELEKKFAAMTISFGGSPRGHNGIKSLQSVFGPAFWRLRFGIDRPDSHERESVGSYVLGSFTPSEEQILNQAIDKASKMLLS